MSDEIEIVDLLAALSHERPKPKSYFPFSLAQEGLNFLSSLTFAAGTPLKQEDIKPLSDFKQKIEAAKRDHLAKVELELQLIRDVLKIETETLEQIAELPKTGRSFVDGLMSVWNDDLERELNLSHFWQQDDAFRLRLNYKAGVFYFEITDKTGAIYTFRERSSGLRYFLSYYIQAKAIEARALKDGRLDCVLLMDEPDSFLSIVGQRNLLNVFESLVFQSKLPQGIQLIYTTHSPFLVNKNFPQRIRLVRKGDGEEGTQYVEESRVRRYEPVRSALGIDCAQTLFMGEANVILEGPTDQYIFSELTRIFSTTAQSIKRSIDDFFKRYKEACNSFDLQLLLERCSALAKYIGEDARRLTDATDMLLEKVHAIRTADIAVIIGENWGQWTTVLKRIRENPLNPQAQDSLLDNTTFHQAEIGHGIDSGGTTKS